MAKPVEFKDHPYNYSLRPPYYRAVCKAITDGDTFDCFIDLGLRKYAFESIRIKDFDAPEYFHPRNELEYQHAVSAMDHLRFLIQGTPIYLVTYPDTETYGRFVAVVYRWDAMTRTWMNVALLMREAGFQKRESY